MTTTREIIEKIGYERLQQQLGVGYKTVNRRAVQNFFPASWLKVIRAECAAQGIECPDELFNFIDPKTKADTAADGQIGQIDVADDA